MKKILLALLLLPMIAQANVFCVRIDSSVNNIATTFSTASTSLVLQGVRQPTAVVVDNRSGSEVALNCSSSATVAPSTTGSNVFYVNSSTAWVLDNTFLSGACYIRSNSGSTISSGIVEVCLIGS